MPICELAEAMRESLTRSLFHAEPSDICVSQEDISRCVPLAGILTQLGFDSLMSQHLAACLIDNDPCRPQYGACPFFHARFVYALKDYEDPWQYTAKWRDFSYEIKHRRRFYDESGVKFLADLFGNADQLPFIELHPNGEGFRIYRSRKASDRGQAEEILKDPSTQLFAPPETKAVEGRMNPRGVSLFYGASREDIAVSEVRPSVGSFVVVGQFRPTHKLKLLDLPSLEKNLPDVPQSIFAEDFHRIVARRGFFRQFHSNIIQPVQPAHEALEYIPTQAVAEFVIHTLRFHGIVYSPVQNGIGNPTGVNFAIAPKTYLGWFHTPHLEFIEGSAELLQVTAIQHTTNPQLSERSS